MKRLDYFDLDRADLQRIDEIITLEKGCTLADETAQWRRRMNRTRLAVAMVLLLLGVAVILAVKLWM